MYAQVSPLAYLKNRVSKFTKYRVCVNCYVHNFVYRWLALYHTINKRRMID